MKTKLVLVVAVLLAAILLALPAPPRAVAQDQAPPDQGQDQVMHTDPFRYDQNDIGRAASAVVRV